MKVLYSQIKELVPGLEASAKQVGEALTYTGFMMDGFEAVKYKGADDYLIGLEIRQNRADCLAATGLARETAAYFNLDFVAPQATPIMEAGGELDINIEASDRVKRVLAIRIDGIKNQESPQWLKEYVAFYGLNSVNLLVDLSNYVMLLTGYPSHMIDTKKTNGALVWSMNHDFEKITTLLGADVKLAKNDTEIIIRDDENIIALAGIIGGKAAEIDMGTDSVVMEIAVYDRSIIRKNSRSLSIVTEASHRLEKDLDPTGAYGAMQLLVDRVKEYAGGSEGSKLFDFYPQEHINPAIELSIDMPSRFAGIDIPEADVVRILKNLEFVVENEGGSLRVKPPVYRMDVTMAEDVVEEVIRVYGYDKIPHTEAPALEVVQNITPKNIILADKIRNILTALGFDEILSLPLTKVGDNELANYADWKGISTQNSVNDVYPDLRQSMVTGLVNQVNEYIKKNVDFVKVFEIGKIFGEKDGRYLERESLGILLTSEGSEMTLFRDKVESLLRLLGFGDIRYRESASKPKLCNRDSCWDIFEGKNGIGIMYKLVPQDSKLNTYYAEIDITGITELLLSIQNNPVVEVTQKLIALDANVELGAGESIYDYFDTLGEKIGSERIWSMAVSDIYQLEDKTRYTIRVTYMDLSDQEAKEIHLKVFGLE